MKRKAETKKRPGLRVRPLKADQARVIAEIHSFLRRKKARGYLVGGLLRDLLTGIHSNDMDLAVQGISPRALASHLHQSLGFSRPAVFPRFDTVLTVRGELTIEISPLDDDIALDSVCRDFTLNCLYADVARIRGRFRRDVILDPTGEGFQDLRDGVLRSPSDPLVTFWLDPLRLLRAIRFHATRGFRLEFDVLDAIPRLAYLLSGTAQERIRDELERIVLSRRLVSSFKLMQKTGILAVILPELDRTAGFSQGTPYHSYDLFTHTLKTAANLRPELNLRMAALLHDLGKVGTRTVRDGRSVYYGHDEESVRIAESVLERLRFSGKAAKKIIFLVGNHMINYSSGWSDRAVRRLMRKLGPGLEDVLTLVEADRKAQHPDPSLAASTRELRGRIGDLDRVVGRVPELPVDGHDIMRMLGIKSGPMVGRAREFLLDEALKRRRPLKPEDCLRLLERWQKPKPGRG